MGAVKRRAWRILQDVFLQAFLDVKSMLGTVGFKGPVDATVVNGRVVVKDGRLTGIDEEKAVREARACCQAYLNR